MPFLSTISGARGLCSALLTLVLVVCASPALAQKTDSVLLKNGDRVTGDVEGIDQGRLELSTDSMGTVNIEVEDIVEITAPGQFVVEDTAGRIYIGALSPDGPGRLAVTQNGSAMVTIELYLITRLQPFGQTLWERLDGSIDLGASYTQSSGVGQGSFSSSVDFRRPSFELASRFDTAVTVQSEGPSTSRTQLQFTYVKIFRDRWLAPGIGQFENNNDLGLKLRSTVGGGFGRLIVSSPRQRLVTAGGIAVNKEISLEGDTTANTEAFFVTTHSFIAYNTPKTGLDTQVFLFPSLTDLGRVRVTLDSRIRRELFKDFTVGVSVFDSFDSRPPTESAAKNAAGASLTVGWTF